MEVCLRRKQQHRAVRDIRARLDRRIGHGASLCFPSCLHLGQEGYTEPRDIDRRAVVPVSIVGTVRTHQPAPPFHGIGSMVYARRAIGVGGLAAAGAGVRGATGLFRAEAYAQEVAFVPQDVPDLCADGRVVAPVAPLAAHAFAPPGGFEG